MKQKILYIINHIPYIWITIPIVGFLIFVASFLLIKSISSLKTNAEAMAYVSYKDQRYEMSFLTQKGELIKNNVGKYRYRNSDFKDSMMVIYHTDYPKEAFFRDLPFARNSPYSDSLVSALFLAIVIGYPIAYIITIINQLNSLKEEEKKI